MPASPDPRWASISRLILGSQSWSRRTLLSTLNTPTPEIITPDIDEASITHPHPPTLTLNIAIAKAHALLQRIKTNPPSAQGKTILICGDSVVTHLGAVLGKPPTHDAAREYLRSYANAPATTVGSIVIVDVDAGYMWSGVDEAEVYFHPMPNHVIEELVLNGGSMQSAGGLRIEHPLVEQYTDCIIGHKSAVMGFSTPLANRLLEQAISGVGGEKVSLVSAT